MEIDHAWLSRKLLSRNDAPTHQLLEVVCNILIELELVELVGSILSERCRVSAEVEFKLDFSVLTLSTNNISRVFICKSEFAHLQATNRLFIKIAAIP